MASRGKRFRQRLIGALFALLASALSLLLFYVQPVWLEYLDSAGRDIVFHIRDAKTPLSSVVVVAVDEKAVKRHGRWPWSRELLARLLDGIQASGAGLIALDIVFPVPESPEADHALIDVLHDSATTIIGGYFFRPSQTQPMSELARTLWRKNAINSVRLKNGAKTSMVPIPEMPRVEGNLAGIAAGLDGQGFLNSIEDYDGLFRHAPLLWRHDSVLFPSLALKSLASAMQRSIRVELKPDGVSKLEVGDFNVPVDEEGRLALNFYDPDRDIIQISAADILEGKSMDDMLAGRLVFVGVTEVGITDVVPTPLVPNYPGVMMHATAVSNVLQEFHLRGGKWVLMQNVAMIFGLPLLLVILMISASRLRTMILAATVVLAGSVGLFYYLVATQGLLVSLVYPVISLVIGFAVFQAYYVLTSQFKNRFLTRAFSSYVSPVLVKQLIDDPDSLVLGGEKRRITILFSDIRSFTALSESMTPETLVDMLNQYLGAMTDIVMENQGTLDKYIGDALMAFFNAPLSVQDHAAQAAKVALAMQGRLAELNVRFQERYQRQLAIGIGLHTGDAVVGNLGAKRRFDYTAIGDTVNLGSRLESATKQYAVPILISEDTRRELGDAFVCRWIDRIQVKGKTEAVKVYELMAVSGAVDAAGLAEAFESALEHYFAQEFPLAQAAFNGIAETHDDQTSRIFSERCAGFLHAPPPADWNGVFVATQK